MLHERNNVCSLQSQASERLQSPEKLIHELLDVLTAGGAAGDGIPSMSITAMTSSPNRQQADALKTQVLNVSTDSHVYIPAGI